MEYICMDHVWDLIFLNENSLETTHNVEWLNDGVITIMLTNLLSGFVLFDVEKMDVA